MEIRVEKTNQFKSLPDMSDVKFGTVFTDHMFIMDYHEDRGWYDPRIVPYGTLDLDPASVAFHYGQTVFEGLKAYRNQDDVYLFRPDENFKRLNNSSKRLCMPEFDEAPVWLKALGSF